MDLFSGGMRFKDSSAPGPPSLSRQAEVAELKVPHKESVHLAFGLQMLNLGEQWYTSTMNMLGTWLTDRMDLQLHVYQLKILIRIVKKKYRDFRLQGVLDSTLNSKMYETVRNRLILEEATASVREGGMQGISMKDSDEEDD
ncbi:hypothetical protein DNTS_008568 [Danionella cerebrum]|uniref:MUN domain-containing protein n=1 Tax=Danionella cerebrum TaxID=2873325 RepID=A0A553MYG3_9TELE|nr:hypothetical protein DNTS_008568 [Danionella translucida]